MQKQVTVERVINHPISKVWDAISSSDQISKWFIQADFKSEEGYDYTFTHKDLESGDVTTIIGKVLEVKEPTKLIYSWMVEGSGVDTTVDWTLSEEDEGTKVIINHTSAESEDSNPAILPMLMEFEKGWNSMFDELEKFLK